jgi:hypothetical protein
LLCLILRYRLQTLQLYLFDYVELDVTVDVLAVLALATAAALLVPVVGALLVPVLALVTAAALLVPVVGLFPSDADSAKVNYYFE